MEDYLEQEEDQARQSKKALEESRDKVANDKATAEDMRNKAMERLLETKKKTWIWSAKKRKGNTMEMKLWNIWERHQIENVNWKSKNLSFKCSCLMDCWWFSVHIGVADDSWPFPFCWGPSS